MKDYKIFYRDHNLKEHQTKASGKVGLRKCLKELRSKGYRFIRVYEDKE